MALYIPENKKAVTLLVAVLSIFAITGQTAMTEKAYKKCITDANKQFVTLTRNIYKSDSFYGTINNLKCRYLDLVDGKLDDSIPCETERFTYLNLDKEKLGKIRDLNKKEDIALQRNAQLISDFYPSLANLEAFEANVTNRKSYVSIVKNVTRGLMKIQKNMTFIAQAYRYCYQKPSSSTKRMIPDRVILPLNDLKLIKKGFKREELAGALFKQMQAVFNQIKDEFFYRKKCIS